MTNLNQTYAEREDAPADRDLSFLWADGPVTVMLGDVRRRLAEIPDKSVQCVVTSPPYWGLRDYGIAGQLGLESTPEDYVAAMSATFAEVCRVLRTDGTLWLNLGDSYGGGRNGAPGPQSDLKHRGRLRGWVPPQAAGGFRNKDLVGIPWRVAFALQAAGWYLRSDIIWSKPNPMPESVQDRPTKAHEYLFLLTRSERYYYDADAIREPLARLWDASNGGSWAHTGRQPNGSKAGEHSGAYPLPDPRGANKRTVWEIATQPHPEAHFATFPEALVEPCIKAGSREGDLVLDPFAGSGTTLAVARRLGRRAIGIELQPDYLPLIQRRVREAALPLVEVMDGLPEQSFSTLNEV